MEINSKILNAELIIKISPIKIKMDKKYKVKSICILHIIFDGFICSSIIKFILFFS